MASTLSPGPHGQAAFESHPGAPERASPNLTSSLHRALDAGRHHEAGWSETSIQSCGTPRDAAVHPGNRQTQYRLSPSEAGALVSAYQAGQSVAALSREFKLDKSTVQAHLVRANVPLRPQKVLTPDQAAELANLYLAGETLKQLRPKFGVGHNTVQNYLLRAGVELRAAKRRPC